MTEISAALVRELREETNLGMMECKRALTEAGGDKQAAIKLLRERGLAVAQKKSARATNAGLITSSVKPDGSAASLVEVNCETDFVAKNEAFQKFVRVLADKALASDANLAETESAGLTALIQEVGENMLIRRNARIVRSGPGIVASYIHLGGKIGVLAEINATKDATVATPAFAEVAKDICMQIAASAPQYLAPENVPAAAVAAEREIFAKQVKDKPANVIDKIVDGKVKKFYTEICLLNQPYIKEPKVDVKSMLAAASKTIGDQVSVRSFVRYQIGA